MQADSLGNIAWRNDFFCGSNCELFPYHILQAADGGYFFTCAELHNSGFSGFAEKTAIIKTDSLGNEEYRLHPGNPELFTVVGWVLPTDDGNYITAYSDPLTITDNQPQVNELMSIWINKFDINGNEIFNKTLYEYLPQTINSEGFWYIITQIIFSSDDNIIITGYKRSFPEQGFILKVTQEGDFLWIRFITPPQTQGNTAGVEQTKIRGITPTSDGGYIMAGEYFSTPGNIYPEGIQTAIAVKVDSLGCLVAGCDTLVGIAEMPKVDLGLLVYPNPASGTINVVVAEKVSVEKVRVYEVTGRVVLIQSPLIPLRQGGAISLDVSNLKAGMYLLEVETKDGFREVRRLVVE